MARCGPAVAIPGRRRDPRTGHSRNRPRRICAATRVFRACAQWPGLLHNPRNGRRERETAARNRPARRRSSHTMCDRRKSRTVWAARPIPCRSAKRRRPPWRPSCRRRAAAERIIQAEQVAPDPSRASLRPQAVRGAIEAQEVHIAVSWCRICRCRPAAATHRFLRRPAALPARRTEVAATTARGFQGRRAGWPCYEALRERDPEDASSVCGD